MRKNFIVVTDLDGSLLDHHTYGREEAEPALRELERLGIPLVLNSSKTAAEMLAVRRDLGNHEPFAVENGAGILAPSGTGIDTLERIALGLERGEILAAAHRLRKEQGYRFRGFADMSVEELSTHTGLGPEQAALALQREFTEPLLWQDSEERLLDFREALDALGITVSRGGRFLHLSGRTDKGRALDWLRRHYGEDGEPPEVIALGDGDNDRPMLMAADYPVLVRSPVNPPPLIRHPRLIITEEPGPAGWNGALLFLLQALGIGQ